MARNRHNIGFMAIDVIAHRTEFSPWRRRFKGVVAEGEVGGERVLALKPLTYMNDSGESVQAAAAFYKLAPDAITAFHDELDLAPGKVRVKRGGGAAGHNGLRSMDRMLGTHDYWRVRLGIGHPGAKERVTGHVLGDFAKGDRDWVIAAAGRGGRGGAAAGGGQARGFHDEGSAADARRGIELGHRWVSIAASSACPTWASRTLFNALTATAAAQAANYPFCTIEPNVGRVAVPDARLDTLARIGKSAKIVPTCWSSSTSPGWCAAPARARAWATSSSPTSARWTRSSTCCAASRMRT